MTFVAVALAVGWAVSVSALAGLMRGMTRAGDRREDAILNKLLHATGHTWEPPPADEKPAEQVEPRPARYTASPETLHLN